MKAIPLLFFERIVILSIFHADVFSDETVFNKMFT